MIWKLSEVLRLGISKLSPRGKLFVSQFLAVSVYLPLAKTAWVLGKLGISVKSFPLSAYRDRSFYSMRTDALDRFGTRLEKRFTISQIKAMMSEAGLVNIKFRDDIPFYCAIGFKK